MPDAERPVYMLIFNDLLKRHHNDQPKFAPSAPQNFTTTKLADKPSLSYSNPSQPSASAGRVSSTATTARTVASQQASRQSSISTPSHQSHASSSALGSSALTLPLLSEHANVGTVVGSALPVGGGGARLALGAKKLRGLVVSSGPGLSQSIMVMKNPQDQPMAPVQSAMAAAAQQLRQVQPAPPTANQQRQNSPAVRPEATVTERQAPLAAGKLSLGLNHPIQIQTKTSSSMPSVGHAPKAAIGTQPGPNQQMRDGSARVGGNHPSIARTIAEQTPNAFRTLGPGFNTGAPAEKSLNPGSNTLASTVVPSDYEHIFHAPSQISDLPTRKATTTAPQAAKHHRPPPSNKTARTTTTTQQKTKTKSKQHASKGKHSHDTGAKKRS